MSDDRRLIEDYLPIADVSVEASGEPRTKEHISTLHIWSVRRPLVACRAADYGALVSKSEFVLIGGTDAQKQAVAARYFEIPASAIRAASNVSVSML